MSIDTLIERLHKVKRTGNGRWIACCPAHNDRNPSLSIRDDNGTILLHCFAGCAVSDIVAAIGLELSDLFPPSDEHHAHKGQRRGFNSSDVLAIAAFESRICAIAAADIANGKTLTEQDRARLLISASRLNHAYEVANGN